MQEQLPKGWEWKRLGDLIELKYGDGLKEEMRISSGKIPVYGSNGIIGYHTKPLISKPCLIVGRKGSIGEIHLSKGPCWPIDTTYYIEIQEYIDISFLYHLLKTLRLNYLNKSTAIPGLNRNDVYSKKIPLPPLSTQKKIVVILERADSARKTAAQLDGLTNELLRSVFYEMFGDPVRNEKGWDVIAFKKIIQETKNGLYKKDSFYGSGIPILRMYNIKNSRIVLENFHEINVTDKEYDEYKLVEGDILFNRVNSPVWLGKSAVIPKGLGKCVYESKNIRIRLVKEKANPYYVVFFLSSKAGKTQIMKHTKPAVNQATVNNQGLREFKMPLPPLPLQQKFARIVEKVDELREKQKQQRQEADNLFNALMQKAFTGELVA